MMTLPRVYSLLFSTHPLRADTEANLLPTNSCPLTRLLLSESQTHTHIIHYIYPARSTLFLQDVSCPVSPPLLGYLHSRYIDPLRLSPLMFALLLDIFFRIIVIIDIIAGSCESADPARYGHSPSRKTCLYHCIRHSGIPNRVMVCQPRYVFLHTHLTSL